MIKKLYDLLYLSKNSKFYLIVYRSIKIFLNFYYPIHCYIFRTSIRTVESNGLILSLTSFPGRINSTYIVIETLLRQTLHPEKIILWLANSQFKSEETLPEKLIELKKRGLIIKFCDDLGPHKKYYYAMKNYPSYTIITVDDDTFYPENLVENLVSLNNKYPNTVCCNLAHLITVNNGYVQPYENWGSDADGFSGPSDLLVPIGCGGVLYPPFSLNINVFDQSQISDLCPSADDLWLKSMASINGVMAVKTSPISIAYANIISTQRQRLSSVNADQKMNDFQLMKIMSHYPQLSKIWQ